MKKTNKKYSQFCGIDVGKNNHVARVMDSQGQYTVRSQSFRNDAAGFEQLLKRLEQAGRVRQILIAMEATGHYWMLLYHHLTDFYTLRWQCHFGVLPSEQVLQ